MVATLNVTWKDLAVASVVLLERLKCYRAILGARDEDWNDPSRRESRFCTLE